MGSSSPACGLAAAPANPQAGGVELFLPRTAMGNDQNGEESAQPAANAAAPARARPRLPGAARVGWPRRRLFPAPRPRHCWARLRASRRSTGLDQQREPRQSAETVRRVAQARPGHRGVRPNARLHVSLRLLRAAERRPGSPSGVYRRAEGRGLAGGRRRSRRIDRTEGHSSAGAS